VRSDDDDDDDDNKEAFGRSPRCDGERETVVISPPPAALSVGRYVAVTLTLALFLPAVTRPCVCVCVDVRMYIVQYL